MNADWERDRKIKELEATRSKLRQGEVTAVGPLTVSVGGGTGVSASTLLGVSLKVGDQVQVLQRGPDLLVLGVASTSSADWGTYHSTSVITPPGLSAVTANRGYYGQVLVPARTTLTGIEFFSYSASSTARVALYDKDGVRVANRTTNSSTLIVGMNQVPFSSTYTADPGLYYALTVFAGTPNINMAVVNRGDYAAGPGSGATNTSITPPTGSSNSIPVMSTY